MSGAVPPAGSNIATVHVPGLVEGVGRAVAEPDRADQAAGRVGEEVAVLVGRHDHRVALGLHDDARPAASRTAPCGAARRGKPRATSATTSSNSPSVSFWIVYLLAETTCVPRRRASWNAKRAASRSGVRSITRSETAVSRFEAPAGVLVGPAGRDAHDVDVDRLLEVGLDAGDRRHRTVDHGEVEQVAQDLVRALGRRRGRVLERDAVLASAAPRPRRRAPRRAAAVRLGEVDRHELEAARERPRRRCGRCGRARAEMPSPSSSTTR